ncbi:T-cell ecto-ADP-ribosyltransferase 1 [Xyrichtys novacula]|uniref:NAD(P)(+)--arginine ADP-ribosyltransferase n=1 Tax=Xyrichtys novacula TaxID=13765 RepID=A0AAV1EUE9_XYRNO|nr:T-cell ecto-ADP-ribosyltransferase 1 [Xyrichtys novacula]
MWDTRKLPLAVFIFTVLSHKGMSKSPELDMAPDAVDDLYNGCREEAMKKFIESGVLKQELEKNEGFKTTWTEKRECSGLIPGGTKEHTTALSLMGDEYGSFKKTFNNAVKTMGTNVSTYENFAFKSLHFLLIDSMKLAQKLNEKQCLTVYYLSEVELTAKEGSKIRFGGFTVASNSYGDLKTLEDWHERTIFNITTCLYFNLENICSDDKYMVLLSPAEVYTVKSVKKVTEDDPVYTEIVLEQPEMGNQHNCYIFSRSPADVSTLWLVLLLAVLPPLL